MNPWLPVLFASVAGALAFFFAGYFMRRVNGRAAQRPSAAPDGSDVPAMLTVLRRSTRSEAVALMDADGLIVHATPSDSAAVEGASAVAGTFAAGLAATRSANPEALPGGVFESRTNDGRALRLRYVAAAGTDPRVFAVATIGARAPAAPAIEDRIAKLVPRLHLAAS